MRTILTLSILCDLYEIQSGVFAGCTGLQGELHLPNTVTRIDDEAFMNCSGLEIPSDFPASLESIGRRAFKGCVSFAGELVLPEHLTSIWDEAFSGCTGLSGQLVLPTALKKVLGKAFLNCPFSEIYVKSHIPPEIVEDSFEGMPFDIPVHVECGIVYLYQHHPYWHVFERISGEFVYEFLATSSHEAWGTVTIQHEPDCQDDQAVLLAEPNDGMRFSHWTKNGNIVSRNPQLFITVDENIEVVGHFVPAKGEKDAVVQP